MPRSIAVTTLTTLTTLLSLSLGCDDAIVANGVGEPVVVTIGVDGGDVELQNGDVTFTLSVPALALAEETELTLQQVDIQGIDGEAAVRFSPDGLTFVRAALLTFEPAPSGDVVVGLAFTEGDTDAELVFTTPTADGVSMPIEHFSDAAAVDAEAARQLLGEEDGDAAAAVDLRESIALGLGETLRRVVEPAAEGSASTTERWRFAVFQLDQWHADVLRAAVGDLPGSIRDPETLDAAFERVTEVVDVAGLNLLSQLQEPRCQEPGDEIGSLEDWIRVPFGLVADLNGRGVAAAFAAPCVFVELTVDGDETLQATDTEVVLDLNLQLVFDGNRREPMDFTLYSLDATGATGPEEFTSRDGRAPGLVFTRPPAGPTRPRAVTITVNVATGDTQLGTLLQPPPFVFVAAEAMTATATATPSTISQPGGTSEVCVTVDASGEVVADFSMRVTTSGPGSIPGGELTTPGNQLCATFTAPTPLPQTNATATVDASVTVDGAVMLASVEIGVEAAGLVGSTLSGTMSVEGTVSSTGEVDNFSGFLRVEIAPDDTVTILDGTGSALNNTVLCDRFGVVFTDGPGLVRYVDPFPATDFIRANSIFAFKDLGLDCLVVVQITTITLEDGQVVNGAGGTNGTGRLAAITFDGTFVADGITTVVTGSLLPE